MLGQLMVLRTITMELHLIVCRKVSWAGSCGPTVTVREIIGSSNLPVCTLISCVILGLLLQVARPRVWLRILGVFLTNQINHYSVWYRCLWCFQMPANPANWLNEFEELVCDMHVTAYRCHICVNQGVLWVFYLCLLFFLKINLCPFTSLFLMLCNCNACEIAACYHDHADKTHM